MSAANAHQAKRVMNVDCLSSVCLNLLDSYPRIKALHFHQKYVASLQGNSANIESFFHIRRGIESQCSCSQSYAMVAKRIFAAGQASSCPLGAKQPLKNKLHHLWQSFWSIFLFSSVMCHRHTPSSKRNLSSKIFAKGDATYFLPLAKLLRPERTDRIFASLAEIQALQGPQESAITRPAHIPADCIPCRRDPGSFQRYL